MHKTGKVRFLLVLSNTAVVLYSREINEARDRKGKLDRQYWNVC